MLQDYLEKLCKELSIATPKLNEQKLYSFKIVGETVAIRDLDPGIAVHAQICAVPNKKKEELFMYLMRANLLGQGTASTRIGMDANEKFLTLSLGLPYELNYQTFREAIEDFVNYLIYWREEVAKFENEESIY
ncbi:MAG: type III secretion system chaperone [Parachlamydiales bacterium]|nr:type III secretion system chaperone [Parachlamydiales bacterium]